MIDKEKLAYEYAKEYEEFGAKVECSHEEGFLAGFDKAESLYKAEVEELKDFIMHIEQNVGIDDVIIENKKLKDSLQKEKAKNKELIEELDELRSYCNHEEG